MQLAPDLEAASGRLNRQRLAAFVESALRHCDTKPEPVKHLQANAEVLRRHLNILARPAPCPAHLLGLNAFDLADAADALEAEATRRILGC